MVKVKLVNFHLTYKNKEDILPLSSHKTASKSDRYFSTLNNFLIQKVQK